jgi:AAA15 family ATPase/GTPase
MFKSIEINNLRAIKSLKADNFGQVNLFVGHNGCGKTSLLEGLFYLCGATNPRLPMNTNVFRGLDLINNSMWSTFFRDGELSRPIIIEATYDNELVSLTIKPHPVSKELVETSHQDSAFLTTGGDFPKTKNKTSEKLINGLILEYSSPKLNALQVSEIFLEDKELNIKGKSQIPVNAIFLSSLKMAEAKDQFGEIQRQKKKGEIIELLQEIDSRITDLSLNEIGIIEADVGSNYLIPITLMGGGITKFLNITLAMYSFQNGVVLIDEIENGLHHSVQNKIWSAVFSLAHKLNIQVFVTTHSWECLNAFHESSQPGLFGIDSKLFRIERDENLFNCVEFTQDELKTSLENRWEVR